MYSKSRLQELKDKYKHLDPSTLENNLLMDEARNGGYICPKCGNGTGEDGTGTVWHLLNDGYHGYCHKCHQYFDVFDLIAQKYRYNLSQFPEIIEKAQELFGDSPCVTDKKPKVKEVIDFTNLIKRSWLNLDSFYTNKKKWRGLLKATLVFFGCGYLPDWTFGKFNSERIIIPTSKNHYLARYVGEKPLDKKFQKIHRGEKGVFGDKRITDALQEKPDSLVFVVEGEIDAMSIYQSGFLAVALGGSTISTHQLNILQKKFPPNTHFIIMLDNDEAGKKNSPVVIDKIRKSGFPCTADFLNSKFSDANDWLVNDESGLKAELTRISIAANKFFSDNPPAKTSELPKGIKKTDVEGIVEITHDFKPPENLPEEPKIQFTQEQILTCPLNLKVPTGFSFTPNGIYHFEKSKDKETKGEVFEVLDSATPIIPTRILMKKDRSDKQVELAYYERAKNIWHKITAPATTIAKTQNITDLAADGVDVNSPHARQMSEFLMKIQHEGDNLKTIPQAILYDQTGWIDECKNFVYPAEGVIDGENYVVKDNGFNYEQKFSSAGTKEDWYQLFLSGYTDIENWWVRYSLGLVLAAPLVKPCNSRNWQGVLVSPSGSGKSAVAKLAISIFGNPAKYHTTFNGTNNFSDELAARLNDLPCWIDEFQAADKKTREEFQNFIYNYAEGKTRGRLTRNADMKRQFEFSGTRICTSEQVVMQNNFMQGAFNRVIQIQNFKPLQDGIGRELHEKLKSTYGHYGKMWIEYVKAHRQEICDTYAAVRAKYRSMNFISHHLQQIALAYTALQYFYRMLREDIEKIEEESNADVCWIELPTPLMCLEGNYDKVSKDRGDIHFFRELLPTPQESNNVVRALNFLKDITSKHGLFNVQQSDGDWYFPASDKVIGYLFNNGDVGFLPSPLDEYLREKNYPPAPTLMKEFANRNLLTIGNGQLGKQLKVSKYIKGCEARKTLYYFPKKSFEDDFELDKDEKKN